MIGKRIMEDGRFTNANYYFNDSLGQKGNSY
jgi:hypothetical protein